MSSSPFLPTDPILPLWEEFKLLVSGTADAVWGQPLAWEFSYILASRTPKSGVKSGLAGQGS